MNFTKQDLQRLINKKLNDEEMEKIAGTKHFDVCLMNPPFQGDNAGDTLYIHFINKCVEITNNVVVVSPLCGFLNHNEHGSAAYKAVKLHDLMDEYKPEIEEIKNDFDAAIKGKLGISVFNKKNIPNKIKIKYLSGTIIEADKQLDIIDNDNEYLKDFKAHLYKYMIGEDTNQFINLKYPAIYKGKDISNTIEFKHKSLYDYMNCVKNIEGYKIYNKIKEESFDTNKIYLFLYKINASFGEYLYKETYNNAIKYDKDNKLFNKGSILYIKLNKDEFKKSQNICSYLKSDFCRLILKLRGNFYHVYLKYCFVPWLDFSKSYTDEELFKMIGMKYDKDEINKILNEK